MCEKFGTFRMWRKRETAKRREVRYVVSRKMQAMQNVGYTLSTGKRRQTEREQRAEEAGSFYDSSAVVSEVATKHVADFHDSATPECNICIGGLRARQRRHILMCSVKWTFKQFPVGTSKSRWLHWLVYSNTQDSYCVLVFMATHTSRAVWQ